MTYQHIKNATRRHESRAKICKGRWGWGCQNARMLGCQCQRCCLCFRRPQGKSFPAALFARTNLGSGVLLLVLGPWAPTSIIVKCSEAFCQLQTSWLLRVLLPAPARWNQSPASTILFGIFFTFSFSQRFPSTFFLYFYFFFILQHPFGQHAFPPIRSFATATATFSMCESVCELCIYPWQGLLQRVESQRKQKVLFAQFSFS